MKTMIINRFRNKFGMTGLLLFILTICSCSNFLNKEIQQDIKQESSSKTTLVVRAGDVSIADRSIEPDIQRTLDNFSTVKIYGTKSGTTTRTTLASKESLKILNETEIILDAGTWTLEFEGYSNTDSIYYYDIKQNVTIQQGVANTVSFSLKPYTKSGDTYTDYGDFGGLSVKLYFDNSISGTTSARIAKIKTTLQQWNDSGELVDVDTKTDVTFYGATYLNTPSIEVPAGYKKYSYTRYVYYSKTDSPEKQIPIGEYRLKVDFYFDSDCKELINSFWYDIHIARGLTSTLEQVIDLNDIYTINYNYNGGSLVSGEIAVSKYTRKNSFDLPKLKKGTGYTFIGWYENSDFSGSPIAKIRKGTTGNKNLYAKFVLTTLYVNPNGNDNNDGLYDTTAHALKTLSGVKDKIIAETPADMKLDWTIKMNGTFTEAQTITDPSGSEPIPASSITLIGSNGINNSTHQPKDSIAVSGDSPALTIDTEVPVIIKDLKITKGTGLGVNVASDSKIYLAGTPVIDDLYLESNDSYDGTIFLAEDLGSGSSVTITPHDNDYPYYDEEHDDMWLEKYIFSVDTDNVAISDNNEYFHVTQPEGSTAEFFIDDEGKINKNCTVNFISTQTNQTFTKTVLFGQKVGEPEGTLNEYTGFTFAGWFKSTDGGETLTTKVSSEDLVHDDTLTLYAKWSQPIPNLYVDTSDAGSDEHTGAEGSPLKTIAAAINKIKDWYVETDYTIHVSGISLESFITLDENIIATSITIQGTNNEQDGFKGPEDSSNSSYSDFRIKTSVPVLFKNFKITGRNGSRTGADGILIYAGSGSNITLSEGVILDCNATSSGVSSGDYGVGNSDDGVLYIDENASVTMEENAQITNVAGTGVKVKGGTFVMSDNSKIQNCFSQINWVSGQGISIDYGTVTLNDNALIGGEGCGCTDGAIIMGGGEVTMNDNATISHCTKLGNSDGIIFVKNATFTMNGGTISNNTITGEGKGSAVYINDNGNFIMNDGEIKNNSGTHAVYINYENSTFDMKGGTISSNSDGGVFVDANVSYKSSNSSYYLKTATFKMSDSAKLDSTSFVYLKYVNLSGITDIAKITISDQLIGDDTLPIRATICPSNYETGLQVLQAEEGVTLEYEYDYFAVQQPEGVTETWHITEDGFLTNKIGNKLAPTAVGDIVFNDGSATAYTTDLELTEDQKKAAISIIFYVGNELNQNPEDTTTIRKLGVGLQGGNCVWSLAGSSGSSANDLAITTIQGTELIGDKYGPDNLEQMGAFLADKDDTDDSSKYPAFYWAKNYKNVLIGEETSSRIIAGSEYENGWYLPAFAEFYKLNEQVRESGGDNAMIKAAELVGANGIYENGWYWTATQSSSDKYRVSCMINIATTYSKSDQQKWIEGPVLAIREF